MDLPNIFGNIKLIPATVVKDEINLEPLLKIINLPVKVARKKIYKHKNMLHMTVIDDEFGFPPLAQKVYITKCFFKPKQVPVSYSETVILKIGSTKKRYIEEIHYNDKLMPYKWQESMRTQILSENGNVYKSEAVFGREEDCQYIYLN